MGSPYNTCRARLSGEWVPELPGGGEDYQDLKAWDAAGERLALVRWRVAGNVPAFSVVAIDVARRRVAESERLRGCCQAIAWEGRGLSYRAFPHGEGRIADPCAAP